ncbi:hypothetical protein CPB83DRAFT_778453, partial [Crepidotus variabilis]
VRISDWIPAHLPPEAQDRLRREMTRPISKSDRKGFLYVLELGPPEDGFLKVKIGRTVNVRRRCIEWRRQCPSTTPALRVSQPGGLDLDGMGADTEPGVLSHLLERCVLIEIEALAASQVYLDPEWPNVDSAQEEEVGQQHRVLVPCPDCRQRHREVFRLRRWGEGDRFGMEWKLLIIPVVKRWGEFVEWYADNSGVFARKWLEFFVLPFRWC